MHRVPRAETTRGTDHADHLNKEAAASSPTQRIRDDGDPADFSAPDSISDLAALVRFGVPQGELRQTQQRPREKEIFAARRSCGICSLARV